jgi:GT2 family glycosyltransferase
MKTSLIILNYNGEQFLPKLLDSIQQQTLKPLETIIYDNASTDHSVQLIQERYPWVRLIAGKENLYFCRGNNEAFRAARGEFVFFLNVDLWLHPKCLEEMEKAVEEDVGVYGPTQQNYEGTAIVELGMGIDRYGFPWQRLPEKVFYIEGSAFFIRRDLFELMGGFDPDLVIIGEDVDLCWRLQLRGYRVKVVSPAVVYHKGGGVMGGAASTVGIGSGTYTTSQFKRFYGERNQLRNLLKNYARTTLWHLLPRYFFWKVVEMIVLILSGQGRVVREVYWTALRWNIAHLPETFQVRKTVQATRTVSDRIIKRRIMRGNAKLHMFFRVGVPKIS